MFYFGLSIKFYTKYKVYTENVNQLLKSRVEHTHLSPGHS